MMGGPRWTVGPIKRRAIQQRAMKVATVKRAILSFIRQKMGC